MKTLLITITLSLTALTVQAQLSNSTAQSYANEVFENAQGYIEEYTESDGTEIARGFANEHLDFSMIRTMVGLIASTNSNVEVVQSWQRTGENYNYGVVIDRKHVMVVYYLPQSNGLIVGYTEQK